jgi:type III pantothenate kinase
MLLVVNSNNTNTVFGAFEGQEKRASWRISTDPKRTADEYAVWLTHLMALQGMTLDRIDGVVVSNVVPQAMFNLRDFCRRYAKADPVIVGEKGVVIDLGTATTFDVLDAAGNYTGGTISPGINLAFEALYMGAAKLPRIEIRRPAKVVGTTTVGAMQSGIFWGYVGLIEGIGKRIADELGVQPTFIGTGGLISIVAEHTPLIQHVDPDLTLKGLVDIHALNAGR